MSIFSQLFEGKITWSQAESQIESWATKTVESNPALTATAGAVMSDLKQAASDAISTADTLAGPLLATGATVVGGAFTTAVSAYLGPLAPGLNAAGLDAIAKIRDGLKAALDAEAASLIASLAPKPVSLGQSSALPNPPSPG